MIDRVQDDANCLARMERILDAIGYPSDDVATITEDNLPKMLRELQELWPPEVVPEGKVRTYMRPLVFTVLDLEEPRRDLTPLLDWCPEATSISTLRNIFGQLLPVRESHVNEADYDINHVCWHTHDFGTMAGCPHGCHYCGAGKSGKFIAVGLNNEDYIDKVVGPTIERESFQKCFRMIGWGADLITFEPENGLFDLFTRKLAQYQGRYGYFHTGSANVDWIADLPHRDRLIGVWSVTCDAVARHIEPGAGPAVERFDAGGKCNEMGVPVRYKFKPIIPVRGWRQEYARAIEDMFARSKPESVGFCVLMWNTYGDLVSKIDPDLLDPDYLAAAKEAEVDMKDCRTGPYPHHVRREVYQFFIEQVRRWDPHVPLYISTESREMWSELKGELGQDPRAYLCACGPVALPGRRLGLSPECRFSTYSQTMA